MNYKINIEKLIYDLRHGVVWDEDSEPNIEATNVLMERAADAIRSLSNVHDEIDDLFEEVNKSL